MRRTVVDTLLLTRRAIRESLRQPANEAANAFIPLFFYVVTVGAIGEVAASAFNIQDYKGFQLPVALLQGAAGVAGGAGLGMTLDIQSGYFEKLLLTSTPRAAIVLGRMLAEAMKAMVLALLIVILALAYGSGFEAGAPGVAALIVATGTFALGYSGIGMAIALRTGSPQAAQAGFIIFFPLLFLAPTFAPLSVFSHWLEVVARANPVTYILGGMRTLIIDGWAWGSLLRGAVAVGGITAFTGSLTALALRARGR